MGQFLFVSIIEDLNRGYWRRAQGEESAGRFLTNNPNCNLII